MFFKTHVIWVKAFESQESFISKVPKNTISQLLVEETRIAVSNESDQLIAFDEKCPHQKALLVNGSCKDGQIICPWHQYRFNCENGRNESTGEGVLKIYPTKFEGGQWFVGIEKRLPFWMDPA